MYNPRLNLIKKNQKKHDLKFKIQILEALHMLIESNVNINNQNKAEKFARSYLGMERKYNESRN